MAETQLHRDQEARIQRLERELHLKQLQFNQLLNITQAINNNIKFEDLFRMYQSFLNWELGINRMALFVKGRDEKTWICPVHIGLQPSFVANHGDIGHLVGQFTRLTHIRDHAHPFLRAFDLIIPVMHKNTAIAYALLGDLDQDPDLYTRVQVITTITNVVAVALENKRLFKRQLEQERFKREMELASEIQKMLIPAQIPATEECELASIYRPQLGVGGDYFDFIRRGPEKVSFCIADISGKGLAAALMMSNFQASLRNQLMQDLPMDIMLERLNEIVFRITHGNSFITFFYGEYHAPSRLLRYVNAGHVPSLLLRDADLQLLEACTTPLGCFERLPHLEIGEQHLPAGSLIVCYTDGLTDLRNDKGDFHSEQLLFDFARAHYQLPPDTFNQRLMARMDAFRESQPFPDDVTVLTCRFK
jgi:sigma-B regulation protein RsbU (phosphoserine phosphatase)